MQTVMLFGGLLLGLGFAEAVTAVTAPCGLNRTSCTSRSVTELLATQSALNAQSAAYATTECTTGLATAVLTYCLQVCPSPYEIDFRNTCSDAPVHTFNEEFQEALSTRKDLQWQVFFLIWSILLGALFELYFPRWLPYTVALLLFGISFGAVAETLANRTDCPMYALRHDANSDGFISRGEWDEFICNGCHPLSVCLGWQQVSEQFVNIQTGYVNIHSLTCGDGTANPPGCQWSFDELDAPWRQFGILSERMYDFPTSASSSSSSASTSSSASGSTSGSGSAAAPASPPSPLAAPSYDGDGRLSADELWTPACNLMLDVLTLKDIDPHVLFVVFLP